MAEEAGAVVKNHSHHDIESQDPKVIRIRGGGAGKVCIGYLERCWWFQ